MILSILTEKTLFNSSFARIKKMMDTLADESKKLDVSNNELKYMISDAQREFAKLSPVFINRMNTNSTILKQIKFLTSQFSDGDGKIKSTIHHVSMIVRYAEEQANKKILSAKREDSKRNRTLEKAEVMRFYRANVNQLKVLFDLMNLIIDIKKKFVEIN